MKKFASMIICGAMVFAAAACSNSKETTAKTEATTTTEATTEKETETTTEETTSQGILEGSSADGDIQMTTEGEPGNETTAPSTEASSETSAESTSANAEMVKYTAELTWSEYKGKLPMFYVVDETSGSETLLDDTAILSSELKDDAGSATIELHVVKGHKINLKIETFDPETGNNNPFGKASVSLKDQDAKELAKIDLDQWENPRGATGVWYYVITLIAE